MNHAPNLVLVGPMGAGKTTIGKQLARQFKLDFVDLDRVIEQRTGTTITNIFAHEGEAGFRQRERAALFDVTDRSGTVLATGGGAILDPDNRARLRERGFVVHLHVELKQQLARLSRDSSRPLLKGVDHAQVLGRLSEIREPLYREVANLRFETGRYPTRASSRSLAMLIARHWQPPVPIDDIPSTDSRAPAS